MPTHGGAAAAAALHAAADELGQVLALHRASGEPAPERLSVSAGDRRLLELHRALTGGDLEVAATCEACDTVSVAVLSPEAVPAAPARSAWLGPGGGVREPTYGDLLELPTPAEAAEVELLRRCTVGVPPRAPRPEDLERVEDSLTGPVELACVGCGTALEITTDLETIVLERLAGHGAQIEVEIHLLARAYGWALPTIEALPDDRRSRFARLVAAGR